MRHGENCRGPARDAAKDSEKSGAEDTEQNCAMELSRHQYQREDKTETGRLHLFVREAAEAYKGGGVGDHELCIPQADECNEHSNACSSRMFQAIRHAVDDLLANSSHRQHQE